MPTSIAIIGATILAARMAYVFGGDTIRNMMNKFISTIQSILGINRNRKSDENEKETAAEKEAVREQQQQQKLEEKILEKQAEKIIEERESEKETAEIMQKIEKKRDTIECFIPAVWSELTPDQRMDAVARLVSDMAESLNLSQEYTVMLGDDPNEVEPTVSERESDGKQVLSISDDLYISSNDETAPITLFNHLVRRMGYCRQDEVERGMVEPNQQERKLQALVSYGLSDRPENINIPSIYFLNNKLRAMPDETGRSYISMTTGCSDERRYFSILQPAERIPRMWQAASYDQLRTLILDYGNVSDAVKKCISDHDSMSYYTVKDKMKELYCNNIEEEIDKALLTNSSTNTKRFEHINNQVLYAVSIYQAQSYANSIKKEFADPREAVIEKLQNSGEIIRMPEKQYKWNKGRLNAIDGITVEVITDEAWKKEQENKKKEGGQPHPKSDNPKEKNGQDSQHSQNDNDKDKEKNKDKSKDNPKKPAKPNKGENNPKGKNGTSKDQNIPKGKNGTSKGQNTPGTVNDQPEAGENPQDKTPKPPKAPTKEDLMEGSYNRTEDLGNDEQDPAKQELVNDLINKFDKSNGENPEENVDFGSDDIEIGPDGNPVCPPFVPNQFDGYGADSYNWNDNQNNQDNHDNQDNQNNQDNHDNQDNQNNQDNHDNHDDHDDHDDHDNHDDHDDYDGPDL